MAAKNVRDDIPVAAYSFCDGESTCHNIPDLGLMTASANAL